MKKIKMYTTPFCPFCIQAKRLLGSLKVTFEDTDLSQNHDLRQKLSQENGGWRTVPMIFIESEDGSLEFIGGFTELSKAHSEGKLNELIP